MVSVQAQPEGDGWGQGRGCVIGCALGTDRQMPYAIRHHTSHRPRHAGCTEPASHHLPCLRLCMPLHGKCVLSGKDVLWLGGQ
jgi:hypothetical protein